MQRSNSSLSVSPTEQMFALNRITQFNRPVSNAPINASNSFTYGGLGDPITSAIVTVGSKTLSFMKSIVGLFTKDPNRDIQIPAQNAAVQGFQGVLGQLDAKMMNGTLTQNDIAQGAATILSINQGFTTLCNQLSAKYPNDASRYQAGARDVSTLANNIAGGTNLYTKYAGHYTQSNVISSAIQSVTSLFGGGSSGSSLTPMLLLGAAFFIVPKLIRSK